MKSCLAASLPVPGVSAGTGNGHGAKAPPTGTGQFVDVAMGAISQKAVPQFIYVKQKASLRIDFLTVLTVSVARVAGGGGHHSRCIVV